MAVNDRPARDLHSTTDAHEWAAEFVSTHPDGIVDIGTLIVWFANAIEVGRMAGAARVDEGATVIEFAPLADSDFEGIGMALATLEAAIGNEAEIFRAYSRRSGVSHAQVVGDAAVFALAMRGFVIVHNPTAAATVAAEYERAPEQKPKPLS